MDHKNFEIKELFDSAVQNHKEKNFLIAQDLYRKILDIDSNHFGTNYLLGTLYLQIKKFNEAKLMFIKSIKIKDDNVDVYNNLGITFSELGEFEKAISCYQKAIKIQPDYAFAYNNFGNVLKRLEQFDKAISHYKKAIEIKSDYIDAHKNLMQIYEKTNQERELKSAILDARNLIKDDPIINLYEGILLYRNEKFNDAKKFLEKISFGNNETNINKETLRVLTLAKCYDRIGNYDKAFAYFSKANYLFPQQEKTRKFDKNRFLNEVKIRSSFFKKSNINKWPIFKSSDKRSDPIFLIGFPRSGTTLLDVILDSHPMIEVIEEKNSVEQLVNSLNKSSNGAFEGLKNIKNSELIKAQKAYFDSLEAIVQNKNSAKVYIDKLPLNIIYVGEILRIFPNSKFILSLRHPCDCVLSCFMQDFKLNDAMANFLNLKDSAYLFNVVMKLWDQYISIFSINYHVVKYENLVGNLEDTIKSLLNFLKLPWDNSVAEYLKTAKGKDRIFTPSYNQVTKPIYKHATGRWKHYKKQTLSIYPILESWIKRFNY